MPVYKEYTTPGHYSARKKRILALRINPIPIPVFYLLIIGFYSHKATQRAIPGDYMCSLKLED